MTTCMHCGLEVSKRAGLWCSDGGYICCPGKGGASDSTASMVVYHFVESDLTVEALIESGRHA